MQLFKAFEDTLYLAVYLGAFDECEHDRDVPYWGLEARYSLVSHHVYPKFSDEGIGVSSVAIEEEWGNACGF